MEGNAKARWIELCEQAANEQDSAKLLRLIREIDKLLREKHGCGETAKLKVN
jgi:hypothetical protein